MSGIEVKVKKFRHDAIMPTYATDGAACFDLYSLTDGWVHPTLTVETGLSFEIPENHVMLVFSRSGHGFKNDIRLANCVGVIDSDYRGEVKVKLTCDDEDWPMEVRHGGRVAQALVLPIQKVQFKEVGELSITNRGENGFGSTGD